jgi:hypothetical protein
MCRRDHLASVLGCHHCVPDYILIRPWYDVVCAFALCSLKLKTACNSVSSRFPSPPEDRSLPGGVEVSLTDSLGPPGTVPSPRVPSGMCCFHISAKYSPSTCSTAAIPGSRFTSAGGLAVSEDCFPGSQSREARPLPPLTINRSASVVIGSSARIPLLITPSAKSSTIPFSRMNRTPTTAS